MSFQNVDGLYPNGQAQVVTLYVCDEGSETCIPWDGSVTADITSVVVHELSTTPVTSEVASSAISGTLLAANASRLGATICNNSTQILYLKLGAAAALNSFTIRMAPYSYYEVPYGYVGIITGLWVSANGSALITELT